jgi:hypothetical protein
MNTAILVTVFGGLIVGAVILAVVVMQVLKRTDSIELVQGKLENSDSAIADAMPYLKITNEWSK